MVMTNGLIKLSCDEKPENVKLIDKAKEIENRSRANFIRTACLERAKRIIKENATTNPKK